MFRQFSIKVSSFQFTSWISKFVWKYKFFLVIFWVWIIHSNFLIVNYGCGTGHYLSLADLGGAGGSGEQGGSGGAGGFEDFSCVTIKFTWSPTRLCNILMIPLHPLTSMSDQNRISPYSINTISSRQGVRVKKNINLGIISWSNAKFSELTW